MKKIKNIFILLLSLCCSVCLIAAIFLSNSLSIGNKLSMARLSAYAKEEECVYATFDTPVVKEKNQSASFKISNVSKSGVYQISPKFSEETVITDAYSGIVNDKYPSVKSFNTAVGTVLNEDGYSDYVYSVYLEEGENTLTLYMAQEAKLEGVRVKFLSDVDAMAVTNTVGVSTVVPNMFYGIRLVQASQYPIKTSVAELVIEEDGWYDLSYFGSATNQGEIYFTLTDEIGQKIEMCSINLTWTKRSWIFDGIADSKSSADVSCLFTHNSYVIDEENPKDTIDNPYVRLFKGTYKVVVESKKLRPVGDNCQVYYGGAVFVNKVAEAVGEGCNYEVTSVTEATCENAQATTYTCQHCQDSYTKKTAEALGHDYQVKGGVAADGSAFMECSRIAECGEVGHYKVDCGEGIAVYNDTSVSKFNVTVEKGGMYKAYIAYSEDSQFESKTYKSGIRNTAYPNITGFGSMTANSDYNGHNSFGFNVLLNEGANELALYLQANVTVMGVRIEFVEDVDAVASASTTGSSTIIAGYMIQHLLVQGNRNPSTIETTMVIEEDGTYDLSYLAGSTNDGNLSVTLSDDTETIVLKSTGLAAENVAWSSAGLTLDWDCAMLSHNLYVYDAENDALTDVHNVDLKAGTYKVVIAGDAPNGYRQVWFGGGLCAKQVNSECEHDFTCVEEETPTCTSEGYKLYRCGDCGYFYEEKVLASHSYKDQALAVGESLTCSVCGTQEYLYEETKVTTVGLKNTGLVYDFTLTPAKTGIYRIWLSYDYNYTGAQTKQRTGALINYTLAGDSYYATGHSSGYTTDVLQSWNYVTNESAIPYGYVTDAQGGYNSCYYDMYMVGEQANVLRWILASTYDVTVNGVKVQLITEVDALAQFTHIAKDWTASYMNSGDKVGLRLNVIQGSGQAQHDSTTTVTIVEEGYYDLSYFATTPHANHEIRVTLKNDYQTIEMTSNDLVNEYASYMDSNASFGRMLYNANLYLSNGEHLVFLSKGEWTVTVNDTVVNNNVMLFFGGAVYFTYADSCNHEFQSETVDPTCEGVGYMKRICNKCSTVFEEEIAPVGHSYKDETNTGSLICTHCGVQETVLATAPATNKSAGAATNSFTVNVQTAGVYEIYLDYTYVKQSDASKQDVGALINKTLFPNYHQTSAQMSNMVGFIQSFNYVTNEASIGLGYAAAATTGYNSNYFNVYLQQGDNELVLHTNYLVNAEYSVTIRGAKLVLVKETEAYVVTNHDGRVHTGNWFGSNVGFNLNLISNSNNSTRTEGTAEITLSGGTYDLSYLATAYSGHTDNELQITLVKGETEIVMTSNKIYTDVNTTCTTTTGKMLLSENLYTADGNHLVDLEEGTWTVKVYCTNTASYRALMFGGLFFTQVNAE